MPFLTLQEMSVRLRNRKIDAIENYSEIQLWNSEEKSEMFRTRFTSGR